MIKKSVFYDCVQAEFNKNVYLHKWQNEAYACLPEL